MSARLPMLLAAVAGCSDPVGAHVAGGSTSTTGESPASETRDEDGLRRTSESTASGDGGSTAAPEMGTTDTTAAGRGEDATGTSGDRDPDGDTDGTDTTDDGVLPESTEGTGQPALDDTLVFSETFDGGLASAWPVPWLELGGLLDHGIDGDGRGWLRGSVFTVGRLAIIEHAEIDVDMAATVTFTDFSVQGVGLYVRQNGGWLLGTDPPGEGYVAFLEGHGTSSLGIWREHEGVEELLASVPIGPLLDGVPYRLRLQCEQVGAATELRARVWRLVDPEPPVWHVTHTDGTASLQDVPGGFAVDMFNYVQALDLFVDDIVVSTLP